jgi:hypothetical protein
MPLPILHIAAICKGLIKYTKGFFRKKCKFAWMVKGFKLKQIVWNFVQQLNTQHIFHPLTQNTILLNLVRKPFLVFCNRHPPLVYKIWVRSYIYIYIIKNWMLIAVLRNWEHACNFKSVQFLLIIHPVVYFVGHLVCVIVARGLSPFFTRRICSREQ